MVGLYMTFKICEFVVVSLYFFTLKSEYQHSVSQYLSLFFRLLFCFDMLSDYL